MTEYPFWPSGFQPRSEYDKWSRVSVLEVQNFFEELLDRPVAIVQSGRTGLQLILQWLGITHGHTVFAPKWTSHCVWSHITPIANPSTLYSVDNDVVLCVHHWGYIHTVPSDFLGTILEDSVDSLFVDGSSVFPNGGDVEVVSIPKIAGTRGGGLVIFRDESIRNHFLESERKSYAFEDVSIESSMGFKEAYLSNKETIQRRILLAHTALSGKSLPRFSSSRLSPVLPVPCRTLEPIPSHLIFRHFNRTQKIEIPDFRLMLLVPMHFGVDEETFENCLSYAVEHGLSEDVHSNLVMRNET